MSNFKVTVVACGVVFAAVFYLGFTSRPAEMGLAVIAGSVVLLVLNMDRVSWFKAGSVEARMREMDKAIEKGYATIKDMRQLAAVVAAPVLQLLAVHNRYDSALRPNVLVEMRDRFADQLRTLDIGQRRIDEMTDRLNKTVLFDHAQRIARLARNDDTIPGSIKDEIEKTRSRYSDITGQSFKALLEGIPISQEIEEAIEDFEHFRTTKHLRRPEVWD